MLDKDQIDMIVKELIKNGYVSIGLHSGLFEMIEQIAIKLNYIKPSISDRMESGIDLEEEDHFLVQDEIWKLVLEGKLAPGMNKMNPWFPNLHFTEKGKEHREKLIQEDVKEN
ncbi:MAG: hypothetical protein V3V33_16825 [Candidatus Lokiarchaeia archaeon]